MDIIREAPLGELVRWLRADHQALYSEGQALSTLSECSSRSSSVTTIPLPKAKIHCQVEVNLTLSSNCTGDKNCPVEGNEAIIVDWYGSDDTENPRNWRASKKALTTAVICLYTSVTYAASTMYAGNEGAVKAAFGISTQDASLPLSMFVLSYGIGPMIFGPLSEIPSIGRNRVYSLTFLLFILLSVLTALSKSFQALVSLRFLSGIFGSPCLAIGGASIKDMYSDATAPYPLTVWIAATYVGPCIAPLLSSYAAVHGDWRWPLWEIVILSAPTLVLLIACLPETSAQTILLQRARRLRKTTSCGRFRSPSEVAHNNSTVSSIIKAALIRPLQISVSDPSVTFTVLYTSLVYGIYYSYFEVFPLVYKPLYHFNSLEASLVFTSIIAASAIATLIYIPYVYFIANPYVALHERPSQEHLLRHALFASFLPPIGLFLFGWTAKGSIHWAVSVVGIMIYVVGVYIILQVICAYISRSYPRYSASLFAANECFRSFVAAGAIHFSKPLYEGLGVAHGVSVLAGLSTLGIVGMFFMCRWGRRLREKSDFAEWAA